MKATGEEEGPLARNRPGNRRKKRCAALLPPLPNKCSCRMAPAEFISLKARGEARVTTIVLAEDHNLVREGLKYLLRSDKTLKLLGDAQDGLTAVDLVERLNPDLLLVDLMIPRLHGLEVIRQVKKRGHTKVIVVSMHSDPPYVNEALRNGASGYVLKDSTSAELLEAIRTVAAGGRFVSAVLTDLVKSSTGKKLNSLAPDIYGTLSARERVVLQFAAEGDTTSAIAKKLYISPRTVETHRAHLMKKLSLRTQTDLVRFAIRRKIIEA